MNTEEKIAAAIKKIEAQRDATPVGSLWWVRASPEDAAKDVVVTTWGGDWIIRDGAMNFADADLIVTLHRTIDAQLGLLRVAANNPGCETDEEVALANAILGEHT